MYLDREEKSPFLIHHIAMVGATEAALRYGGNDYVSLKQSERLLAGLGFTLSPTRAVQKINLAYEEGGQDFLAPDMKTTTDVLIFCNIPYAQSAQTNTVTDLSNRIYGAPHTDQIFYDLARYRDSMQVSPLNGDENEWHKKILESGAKIAVFVGADDFPPEKLAGEDFLVLDDLSCSFKGLILNRHFIEATLGDIQIFNGMSSSQEEVLRLAGDMLDKKKVVHEVRFSDFMSSKEPSSQDLLVRRGPFRYSKGTGVSPL